MAGVDREDQFLDIIGFIHRITFAPAGTPKRPWPFLLSVDDGMGETHALVTRADAKSIVDFLTRHMEEPHG